MTSRLRSDLVVICFSCNLAVRGMWGDGYQGECPECGDELRKSYAYSEEAARSFGVSGKKHTGKEFRIVELLVA